MGTPALKEPVTKPTTVRRHQGSWIDVAAATVVAVVVAILTPVVSSIHPLIPIAITPVVTALITVSVRRILTIESDEADEAGGPPSPRRPPPLLHGGILIALVAAVLAFAAAVVLVTAQDLVRGRPLDEGTLVGERITVPDLTGQRQSRALAAIRSAGLEPEQQREFSAALPRFRVLRTDPAAGSTVRKGSAVTVVVSGGPRPIPRVSVPPVVGRLLAQAITTLEDAGLEPARATAADGTPMIVTNVDPAAGTEVTVGSTVQLAAAPAVTVPPVEGRPLTEALSALGDLQLSPTRNLVAAADGVEPGIVTAVAPAADTQVAQGSDISLTVAALIVPDVSGQPEGEARTELTEAGFTSITPVPRSSDTIDVGAVIATIPPAAQRQPSRAISLVVSSGPAGP